MKLGGLLGRIRPTPAWLFAVALMGNPVAHAADLQSGNATDRQSAPWSDLTTAPIDPHLASTHIGHLEKSLELMVSVDDALRMGRERILEELRQELLGRVRFRLDQ